MDLNIQTEFNIGTKLYYIQNNKIQEATVTGIKVGYTWHIPNKENGTRIVYAVDTENLLRTAEGLKTKYFTSKKELLNKLMESL